MYFLYVFEQHCCLLEYNRRHPTGLILKEKVMDESSIKENLARAREASMLSQSEAALRLGINRASFIKLEKGRTRILNRHIPELARIYGVSVEELLLGYMPIENSSLFLEDRKAERKQMIDDYEARLEILNKTIASQEQAIQNLEGKVQLLERLNRRLEKDLERYEQQNP